MGVAGSGKTLIGTRLAQRLGWRFLDADNFHPPENITRMAAGTALTETDREPWLFTLRALLHAIDTQHENVVLACSALRAQFRRRLTAGLRDAHLVYLRADATLLSARLQSRIGHFFPARLLQSQFDDLEEPSDALQIDASEDPEVIVEHIFRAVTATH